MSNPIKDIVTIVDGLERGAAVLRTLGPIAKQIDDFIHDEGPEPAIFVQMPELKSPAALERARVRSKRSA